MTFTLIQFCSIVEGPVQLSCTSSSQNEKIKTHVIFQTPDPRRVIEHTTLPTHSAVGRVVTALSAFMPLGYMNHSKQLL
jgi:hypothetical protein